MCIFSFTPALTCFSSSFALVTGANAEPPKDLDGSGPLSPHPSSPFSTPQFPLFLPNFPLPSKLQGPSSFITQAQLVFPLSTLVKPIFNLDRKPMCTTSTFLKCELNVLFSLQSALTVYTVHCVILSTALPCTNFQVLFLCRATSN